MLVPKRIGEIRKALARIGATSVNSSTHPRTETFIQWVIPLEGWIKLNLDGASCGNPGLARDGGAFGCPIRNWLLNFSVNLDVCSSVKAELLGLLYGLRMAKLRGYSNLIIHMDSQLVTNKMKMEVLPSHAYYFIIN